MRLMAGRILPCLALALWACGEAPRAAPAPSTTLAEKPPPHFQELVPEDLVLEANGGRQVVGSDGRFIFPEAVTRVWVDVGAHHLETFHDALLSTPNLAVIAIEPLAECWQTWPRQNPRLIGIPAAIALERGVMDFHVNAADVTSSLAESDPRSSVAELTRTVEVRKVPVLRLEDVLALVPAHIPIESLKTDVQGLDLQGLKSAGEQLRRVGVVKAEVINEAIYKELGEGEPGTEEEFVTYMAKMGFRFGGDFEIAEGRRWLDKLFINSAFSPPQPEAREE